MSSTLGSSRSLFSGERGGGKCGRRVALPAGRLSLPPTSPPQRKTDSGGRFRTRLEHRIRLLLFQSPSSPQQTTLLHFSLTTHSQVQHTTNQTPFHRSIPQSSLQTYYSPSPLQLSTTQVPLQHSIYQSPLHYNSITLQHFATQSPIHFIPPKYKINLQINKLYY